MSYVNHIVFKVENAENRKTSSWFGWFGSSKNGSSSREENIKIEEIDEEAKQENPLKKEIIDEEPVETTQDDCENALPPDAFISEAGVGGELIDADDDKKYRKSMRLSSEQISQLNLRPGSNEVEFSVTTAFQGTTRATCHIYLWRHSDKIVISDIDGTITKSDVLGHFLPVIGQIWAQAGVAKLFSKIHDNGYKIMYLSARALGQATITKDYLHSVKQGDVCLPDGPIFLNPDSLIHAFRREVIDRNPEEFKIRCLKDIQSLFEIKNPFFAGYGNRPNDAYAYRAVGIPVSRIFTINPVSLTGSKGFDLYFCNYFPFRLDS